MEKNKKYIINIKIDTVDGAEEYEIDAATVSIDRLAAIIEFHPELTGLYYRRLLKEGFKDD